MHFTKKGYDLNQFRGKLITENLKPPSALYATLAAKYSIDNELRGLFIANCIAGHCTKFVDWYLGPEAKQVWLDWLRRTNGMGELVRTETRTISRLAAGRPLGQLFEPPAAGCFPPLLEFYLDNSISLETLIVYLKVFGYDKVWPRKIIDPYLWPSLSLLIDKYYRLLTIDLNKMKATIKEAYQTKSTPNQPQKLPKRSDPNVLSDSEWNDLINQITQ